MDRIRKNRNPRLVGNKTDQKRSQAEQDQTCQHTGPAAPGIRQGCQKGTDDAYQGLAGIHAGDGHQTDPQAFHQYRLEGKYHSEAGIGDRSDQGCAGYLDPGFS